MQAPNHCKDLAFQWSYPGQDLKEEYEEGKVNNSSGGSQKKQDRHLCLQSINHLPCLSGSECVDTKAEMAGYVILDMAANMPAAHIILRETRFQNQYRNYMSEEPISVLRLHSPCLRSKTIPGQLSHFKQKPNDYCLPRSYILHKETQHCSLSHYRHNANNYKKQNIKLDSHWRQFTLIRKHWETSQIITNLQWT